MLAPQPLEISMVHTPLSRAPLDGSPRQKMSPRAKAVQILTRCKREGAYVNVLLQQLHREASIAVEASRFVAALVKGTMEQEGRITALLEPLLKKGLASLPLEVQSILQIATCQLLGAEGAAKKPRIINESVELTRVLGFQGLAPLVNAVLRKLDSRGSCQDSPSSPDALSHPGWLVDKWRRQWGEATTLALCEANNRRWSTFIQVNHLRTDTAALQEALAAEGITTTTDDNNPLSLEVTSISSSKPLHSLTTYKDGMFFIQDASSALVVQAAAPQPGMQVADLCSAPGGKAIAIALGMGNQGLIIASDINRRKLGLLRQSLERLRLSSVHVISGDARHPPLRPVFDMVFVDAPCSGTGTIGRKGDLRYSLDPDRLDSLLPLQQNILDGAAMLVKEGGILVYSTCSLEPEENEETIFKFLARHTHFSVVRPTTIAPEFLTSNNFLRTFPHLHGMAGAFAAVLRHA